MFLQTGHLYRRQTPRVFVRIKDGVNIPLGNHRFQKDQENADTTELTEFRPEGKRHSIPGAIGSHGCHTPMLVLGVWGLQSRGNCSGSQKEPVPLGDVVSLDAGGRDERPVAP